MDASDLNDQGFILTSDSNAPNICCKGIDAISLKVVCKRLALCLELLEIFLDLGILIQTNDKGVFPAELPFKESECLSEVMAKDILISHLPLDH